METRKKFWLGQVPERGSNTRYVQTSATLDKHGLEIMLYFQFGFLVLALITISDSFGRNVRLLGLLGMQLCWGNSRIPLL